ncbi:MULTISPECIES: CPBP family intramembrane glutamic endopeptidase [Enterococcus]|uniref:CPBP family intramembrane glutamic endopeptidase n=1 Tax=Enterococcus TaxID=1350 RepID=UPI0013E9146E|nr:MULTISPECIES: CPBP family intramembrane glutamic endopeptidase [Enterococcus]
MFNTKIRDTVILIYYLVFMIFLFNIPVTSYFINNLVGENTELSKNIFLIIFCSTHFLLFFLSIIFFRKEIQSKWVDFLFNWKSNLKYIFCGIVLIFVLNIILGIFLKQQGTNQESLDIMLKISSGILSILFYLVTVIVGPINEEVVFRRILIGDGNKIFSKTLLLIFSSVSFGLIHIHKISELPIAIPYICAGFIFGYIYIRFNNIFSSIAIHVLNNLIGILLLLFIV